MYQAGSAGSLQPGEFGAILRAMHRLPCLPLFASLAILAGFVATNPSGEDFQRFAADRLVDEIAEELCREGQLPLLLRMAVGNCEQLVRDQRNALAAVVQTHTRRTNLGLFSLFQSRIGGQRLLDWRVPRFHALVLGAGGQFVVLHADQAGATQDGNAPGWFRP